MVGTSSSDKKEQLLREISQLLSTGGQDICELIETASFTALKVVTVSWCERS
jgi:hypothetical protein